MSARTERRRGFTLLELMVAAAVGLIILAAASAAFDLQSQFARNTERLLSAQATAGLGLTMMQRDLENAGLRFRGGAQADGGVSFYATVVRPYDQLGTNITSLRNDLAATQFVVPVSPPSAGFIPGTDAFEVIQGGQLANSQRQAASVAGVVLTAPNQRTVSISPNPFNAAELSGTGSFAPVLMFWADDVHCMGRVIGAITVSLNIATALVQTVDADLAPGAAPWTSGCPGTQMQVDILQQRRRYLVYQTASNVSGSVNRPARIGLHVQSNPPCDPVTVPTDVCSTDLQAPVMVAEGVDDMQIAWRVPSGYGTSTGGWCQHAPTDPTCGFDQPAWTPTTTWLAASVYGAQIMLTSRGQEIYQRPNEAVPQMLNHVPSPGTDGIVRAIMQNSVLFRNSVTP